MQYQLRLRADYFRPRLGMITGGGLDAGAVYGVGGYILILGAIAQRIL